MNNKKRNNTQKKIDYLYQVATNNQTTIKVLSDFFYNYLDMKEKVDGVLQESKDRIEKISRKSVQKDKKEKEK